MKLRFAVLLSLTMGLATRAAAGGFGDPVLDAAMDRCKQTYHNGDFCACRITVNPQYHFGYPMGRIMLGYKCKQVFGDALFR